jgi:hypothetical protein
MCRLCREVGDITSCYLLSGSDTFRRGEIVCAALLRSHGMERYELAFRENAIDADGMCCAISLRTI